jgi:bifunctional non-homologous end joining protein LigD
MWCFHLLELNGEDLRREPIEARKAALVRLLQKARPGLQLDERIMVPGESCSGTPALGLEGIVSKRLGSRYVSGRTQDWIKSTNPNAPAATREIEEDWGKTRRR